MQSREKHILHFVIGKHNSNWSSIDDILSFILLSVWKRISWMKSNFAIGNFRDEETFSMQHRVFEKFIKEWSGKSLVALNKFFKLCLEFLLPWPSINCKRHLNEEIKCKQCLIWRIILRFHCSGSFHSLNFYLWNQNHSNHSLEFVCLEDSGLIRQKLCITNPDITNKTFDSFDDSAERWIGEFH